jgi:hypothetical protein
MTRLPSYPKPLNLGHRDLPRLEGETVVIQEKVDGSQISFGVRNGELFVCSRRRDIELDHPGMFANAVAHLKFMVGGMREGWIYRGEYLQKLRHNVLGYARVPTRHIILFDIDTGSNAFLSPGDLEQEAQTLGLMSVPCYYWGVYPTKERLLAFLDHESILGGVKIEGIVIKSYGVSDRNGIPVMVKLVSEDFREAHTGAAPKKKIQVDVVDDILTGYQLKARWRKAVQHLQEAGAIFGEPRDIGPLLRELQQDFETEEKEQIKELLYQHFRKQILKGVGAGLPTWYKQRLAFGDGRHEDLCKDEKSK